MFAVLKDRRVLDQVVVDGDLVGGRRPAGGEPDSPAPRARRHKRTRTAVEWSRRCARGSEGRAGGERQPVPPEFAVLSGCRSLESVQDRAQGALTWPSRETRKMRLRSAAS